MKFFYWSPFLTPIATPRAVINSAHSLQKFSKKNYCFIINFFGEFNIYKKELENNQIRTINFFGNLASFQHSSHEWVGIISYYLMGRSSKII